jgi:hypothetical protein
MYTKKVLLLAISLFSCVFLNAQNRLVFGEELKVGPSAFFFDKKTSQYFNNTICPAVEFNTIIKQNFLLGLKFNLAHDRRIKKTMVIGSTIYNQNSELTFDITAIRVGYRTYVRNDISIDTYLGFCSFMVKDFTDEVTVIHSRKGYTAGLSLMKFFQLSGENVFHIYFNCNYNRTESTQELDILGKNSYAIEIGVGGSFGRFR